MLTHLLKPIGTILLAKDYVGKYGGLVRTVKDSRPSSLREGFVDAIYPVSADVDSEDCWNNNRYKDLVPDGSKKSVFYIEDIDGLQFVGQAPISPRGSALAFKGRVRLVGWLNLPKLGVTASEMSGLIGMDLLKSIDNKRGKVVSPFPTKEIKYTVERFDSKNINPFAKYTYSTNEALLFYPYDFVSLVIVVEAIVDKSCFEGIDIGEAVCK